MSVPLSPIRCLYRGVDLYGKKTIRPACPNGERWVETGEPYFWRDKDLRVQG